MHSLIKIYAPQIGSDQLTKCNNQITELELINALKALLVAELQEMSD